MGNSHETLDHKDIVKSRKGLQNKKNSAFSLGKMNDTNLGSDSHFNKSDDNDSAIQRDSIELKITKPKPLVVDENSFTAVDPKFKAKGKPK